MPSLESAPRRRLQSVVRCLWVASLAGLVVACGGGGGDDDAAGGSGGGSGGGGGSGNVSIQGRITYDFVPAAGGLDYGSTEERPARFVSVQFLEGTRVLSSTSTDDNGVYSLSVPPNTVGFVRARAESVRAGTGGWTFRVRDNVSGDAIYTLDGASLSSGTATSTRDLRALSGWAGQQYLGERAAAPFAILDTIIVGAEFLSQADIASFPALNIHWSPDNVPAYAVDEDGNEFPDPSSGEIGSSFYGVNAALGINGIYLVGDEDTDTDEYDRHVILHEFGHYLESAIGRSDSIGGPHARGDRLDPRVAFSEGWGTAVAALALDNPVYRDSGGFRQGGSFSFNVETASSRNPASGWYSEESVWELLYDLMDTNADSGDSDLLNYPIRDIWSVLAGRVVTTPARVTIFPFINAFRDTHSADETLLGNLLNAQSISLVSSDYAAGETNDAGSADVLPLYTDLSVNGAAVNVCSTDEFTSSGTGATNKLASRRFIRFTPPASGTIDITVTATSIPAGQYADPDFVLHRIGSSLTFDGSPTAACRNVGGPGWTASSCIEPDPAIGPSAIPVINADYVLEVYEWTHTIDSEEYPPIGRTCFDVRVTQ